MHTVILNVTCKPGTRNAFVATLSALLVDTRTFSGCKLAELYCDQDNADKVMVWEKWESRADHEAYVAWRVETGVLAAAAEALAAAPEFLHYDAQAPTVSA